jgi:putative oxidoreductase
MKIAVIIVRILVGLLLVISAVTVLFNMVPQPQFEGKLKMFNDGITASGYFMPLLKIIELLIGLALITGRFVPLASIALFPIMVNVVFFHAFLMPEGLIVNLIFFACNIFLIYACRKNYSGLAKAKIITE